MTDAVETLATDAAQRRFGVGWAVTRNHAVWGVASLAAWAHTIDELRIGELVALPFATANAVLVAMWPRLSRRDQVVYSVGFGLFWALAAIPYHLVPLLGGAVTWQNVSGLARVVAGVAMIALGISIALTRRKQAPPGLPG
jgi:hypothetical protein